MRLGGVWTHAPPILTLTPMTLSLSFFPVSLSPSLILDPSDIPLSRFSFSFSFPLFLSFSLSSSF